MASTYGRGNVQSSGCVAYDHAELQRARSFLMHERKHGKLQILNSRQQQFSLGSVQSFTNVWEGEDGMMTYISREFPMPSCVLYMAEQSPVSQPLSFVGPEFVASPQGVPETLMSTSRTTSSNTASEVDDVESYRKAGSRNTMAYVDGVESYGKVNSSNNMSYVDDVESCEKVNSSNNMFYVNDVELYGNAAKNEDAESGLKGNAGSDLSASRNVGIMAEKISQSKLSKINGKLISINKLLSLYENMLHRKNLPTRKRACVRLANAYKRLKLIHKQIVKGQNQMEENDCNNILMPMGQSAQQEFQLKGKSPLKISYILAKWKETNLKLRSILLRRAKRIEPYKELVSTAITELLREESLESHSAPANSGDHVENRDSGVTDQEETFDVQKIGDGSDGFNNGQELSTFQGHSGEGVNGCHIIAADVSSFQFTENMFWSSLNNLRQHILEAISRINKINKCLSKFSTKLGHQNMSRSPCQQLVDMHTRINYFSSHFQKLTEVMAIKHYPERGLCDLKDFGKNKVRLDLHLRPDSSSLEVVEAMLNNLKSVFMRVRDDRLKLLEGFGYISDPSDLTFLSDKGNRNLVRICSHSETCVDAGVILSSQDSLSEIDCDLGRNDKFVMSSHADFLEKEKQHWERLQALSKRVYRCIRQVNKIPKRFGFTEEQMKSDMENLYLKITGFNQMLALESSESMEAGYCKMVRYRNVEFQTQNFARMLVNSLGQVKANLKLLCARFRRAAGILGLSHLYRL